MDKKLFSLLQKPDRTPAETHQIAQFMSFKYFRSLITPLPINELIQHVRLLEWSPQTTICQQSEKIDQYFFLIEGSVNVYKKLSVNEEQSNLQIVKNINEASIISDSFFSHSPHRLYTVITNDSSQGCRGFAVSRQVIEQLCGCLIKEYKILKQYFCMFINLSSDRFYKIDLYENVVFKSIKYGQSLKIDNQVLIIYSGQCLMNFQEKVEKNRRNDSPFRVKEIKSRHYRPLLKLCQNECIGMELLFPQNNPAQRFKYIVTSEKLVCISIAIKNVPLFPKEMTQKLRHIHCSHMEKLQENISTQKLRDSRMALQNGHDPRSLSPVFTYSFSPARNSVKPSATHQFTQNQSQIRQRITSIPTQKAENSPSKMTKSRFRLPNIKFQKIQGTINDSLVHLNRTQFIGAQKSPLKENSVNKNDVNDLRKKYLVGFDLKNKCDREQENSKIANLKKTIKEPKGYFPFAKSKKYKQNSSIHEERVKKQESQHKEWSCYIKLPKLN